MGLSVSERISLTHSAVLIQYTVVWQMDGQTNGIAMAYTCGIYNYIYSVRRKKNPTTKSSISSKLRNVFVWKFQGLLRRKCAANRTSLMKYCETLRKWHDFWILMLISLSRLHWQRHMASKQPGFKCTWLPCLGLDAGQIQPSEPTTEEYPGAEDSTSDDMGWAAARSYQKINRQLPLASARLRWRRRRKFWI